MTDAKAGPTNGGTAGDAPPSRRSFGLTVLTGLVATGSAALAGNQAWATSPSAGETLTGAVAGLGQAINQASAPLVTSLALVVLAAWGVVLVTRGRFRRAIAVLVLLAALGLLAATVGAWTQAPQVVTDALVERGVPEPDVSRTWWAHLAVVAAVVSLAAAANAVRRVPAWPEMGRRYDAPARDRARRGAAGRDAQEAERPDPQQRGNLDLWQAIDDGEDPTDHPTGGSGRPPAH